ncbi:DUF2924 domain-containing protein [Aureimonas leprariae]|uniref:DUF2924 domain-containing protein n=1 Tax=Plantimonas leprariae TaxID=2615207 RepID=A0A7V7PNQ7_9HYPH|nr:DUF2924 domain-containing protein [Aureimonas leprariae]
MIAVMVYPRTTEVDAMLRVDPESLPALTMAEMRREWRICYRCGVPRNLSRQIPVQAITYRLQEREHGGLSPAAEVRLANPPERDADAASGSAEKVPRLRVRRSVKAGTRFFGEWEGRTYEVVRQADGTYRHGGVSYRSLSEIVRLITGTRWSGPRGMGCHACFLQRLSHHGGDHGVVFHDQDHRLISAGSANWKHGGAPRIGMKYGHVRSPRGSGQFAARRGRRRRMTRPCGARSQSSRVPSCALTMSDTIDSPRSKSFCVLGPREASSLKKGSSTSERLSGGMQGRKRTAPQRLPLRSPEPACGRWTAKLDYACGSSNPVAYRAATAASWSCW